METTAGLRLPHVLAAFTQAHPDVDLSLTTGTTPWLTRAVIARELDGAFVAGPVDHPELEAETIFAEEMAIITGPAVTGLDDLGSLAGLKIVAFRSDCAYRQRLEERPGGAGHRQGQGDRDRHAGRHHRLRRRRHGDLAAAEGRGRPQALRDRRIKAFRPPAWTERVDTVFIRRVDAHPSSALSAFLRIARPPPWRGRRSRWLWCKSSPTVMASI